MSICTISIFYPNKKLFQKNKPWIKLILGFPKREPGKQMRFLSQGIRIRKKIECSKWWKEKTLDSPTNKTGWVLTIRDFFIPKACKIADYFKARALLKPNLRLTLLLRKNKSFGSHYNAVTSIHFYGFGKSQNDSKRTSVTYFWRPSKWGITQWG